MGFCKASELVYSRRLACGELYLQSALFLSMPGQQRSLVCLVLRRPAIRESINDCSMVGHEGHIPAYRLSSGQLHAHS